MARDRGIEKNKTLRHPRYMLIHDTNWDPLTMVVPPRYVTSSSDYRSDTFTIPTTELWARVSEASLGDTIYQEDTDTWLLEVRIANEIAGGQLYGGVKAEGLMCVSTTMSNQLAVRSLLNFAPPYSVLVDRKSHIYCNECAGIAFFSQALVIPTHASNGRHLTLEDIEKDYFADTGDIHVAATKLIILENASSGMCFPFEELERISKWAHLKGILLHLDGARLWNAAAVQSDPVAYLHKVCALFDSVSLCLSKSVGAPIGSMLVGGTELIRRARHLQKQQGGGLRQAGFIARIADYCLTTNFPKTIKSVCDKTRGFYEELSAELWGDYGITLKLEYPVETNFIFIDLEGSKIGLEKLMECAEKHDVKLFDGRLSFHHQNVGPGLAKLRQVFLELAEFYKTHPYVN